MSAFEASKHKITNEQFLRFVQSNGYGTREFWSKEGWEWVQFKQARHPLFWICPKKCKSGGGGLISTYSHCQSRHFSENELKRFFEEEPSSDSSHQNEPEDQTCQLKETNFGYK